MQQEIENLKELIINDYENWTSRSLSYSDDGRAEQRVAEFASNIEVKEGGGVKAFIVNTDKDKKFKKGDILKPAGWAAPARNKPRGNVFEMLDGKGTGWVRWTGPQYLR